MTTYEEVAKKYGVTPEQVKQLKFAMCDTWDQIAYDWFSCFGGESEAYDSYDSEAEMVAEATIDADRILTMSQANVAWVYKTGQAMKLAQEAWECSW